MNLSDPARKMSLRCLGHQTAVYIGSCSATGKSPAPLGPGTLNLVSPCDQMEFENKMVIIRVSFFCIFPAKQVGGKVVLVNFM